MISDVLPIGVCRCCLGKTDHDVEVGGTVFTMCKRCFDVSISEAAHYRRIFDALMSAGISNPEANDVVIAYMNTKFEMVH
jgi:cytochrome c2